MAIPLVAMVLLAPGVAGHAFLEASTPEADGALPLAAGVMALRFTELVDRQHVHVHLETDAGQAIPTTLTFPSSRPYEVRIESAPLTAGEYTLRWHALGVDGHTAEGTLHFSVGAYATSTISGPQAYDPTAVRQGVVAFEAVGRTLWMAGLLVILGVPVFTTEVAGVRSPPRRVAVTMAGAGAVAVVGGSVVLGAMSQALEASLWTAMTSTPGILWLTKMALVGTATALSVVAARPGASRRTWTLASVLPAFLAVVMHSMGGHGLLAGDSGEGVAGHVGMTLHLVVAGLWMGGIVGFLLMLPGLRREESAAMIHRLSPLALASVVVVASTGLYQAFIHFPPGAPREGLYLYLLLAKTGLLAALVVFGAWHLWWLRPRLMSGRSGSKTLKRSLPLESSFLVVVIAVAGLLAAVPVPAAQPLGDGPLAVEEAEGVLGDYNAHIAVIGNPVTPGIEQPFTVDLRALTSRGVEQADLHAQLIRPDGTQTTSLPLNETDPGKWTGSVTFDEAGTWQIRLVLRAPSVDSLDLPVRIMDPSAF